MISKQMNLHAHRTRYLVKPFVVTLDGQTVYGAEKEFCVADMIG